MTGAAVGPHGDQPIDYVPGHQFRLLQVKEVAGAGTPPPTETAR